MREDRCWNCLKDLSIKGFYTGWRIKIENEPIPPVIGEEVTDAWVEPIFHGRYFFCGLGCLKIWTDEQLNTHKDNHERDKKRCCKEI